MATELLIILLREGLLLAILLSAPIAIAAFLSNLISGLLQATTQIQGPALHTIPRLVAVAVALVIFSPWIASHLAEFTSVVFKALPAVLQSQ